MSDKANDHMKIIFCLRRKIRQKERSITYARSFTANPAFIKPMKEDRKKLLKVLLAYQLATFEMGDHNAKRQ